MDDADGPGETFTAGQTIAASSEFTLDVGRMFAECEAELAKLAANGSGTAG